MIIKHAVIDGSNIATEGRDAPSLAQLDEAVSAFIDEYSPEIVTVVVDATFSRRGERDALALVVFVYKHKVNTSICVKRAKTNDFAVCPGNIKILVGNFIVPEG